MLIRYERGKKTAFDSTLESSTLSCERALSSLSFRCTHRKVDSSIDRGSLLESGIYIYVSNPLLYAQHSWNLRSTQHQYLYSENIARTQ